MGYVIDPGRSPAAELRRIAGEELGSALQRLESPERKGVEQAVHSVRKSCKRVRALVRLVRPALGSEYRRTNGEVRDASAVLSPLRDAHAVLGTFDSLRTSRPDLMPSNGLADVRAALAVRAHTAGDAGTVSERLDAASALLTQVADRATGWRLKLDLRTLADGAAEFHGMGRKAFERTLRDPSDEQLHEWRKRVKDGWYHTQLLSMLAPSVLEPAVASLSRLSDALGDNNDLAVLSHALRESPDTLGGQQAHEALMVIQTVRDELISRCRPLGARLYADEEDGYRTKLRTYVKAYARFGPELAVGEISKIFGVEHIDQSDPAPAKKASRTARARSR